MRALTIDGSVNACIIAQIQYQQYMYMKLPLFLEGKKVTCLEQYDKHIVFIIALQRVVGGLRVKKKHIELIRYKD